MASSAQTGMDPNMEQISERVQAVTEEALRRISKGPLMKFVQECDDEQYA